MVPGPFLEALIQSAEEERIRKQYYLPQGRKSLFGFIVWRGMVHHGREARAPEAAWFVT